MASKKPMPKEMFPSGRAAYDKKAKPKKKTLGERIKGDLDRGPYASKHHKGKR